MTNKPKKLSRFWRHGQRARLAFITGISRSNLSEILYRKRRVSQERARLLETCSGEVLATSIKWEVWINNQTTDHPAFFNNPLPITPK